MRQGGDPRLPLELALVKVTRPASDLSRESLAFRLEQLEQGRASGRGRTAAEQPAAERPRRPPLDPGAARSAEPLRVELEQLQEAWRRSILPAVERALDPDSAMLAEAHPAALAGDTLTLEFPQTAAFHLQLAEEPKNAALLRDALYEVTGRKLAVVFELGET